MFRIEAASPVQAETIAQMVKALLEEIMSVTGAAHFTLDFAATTVRCRDFLHSGEYAVLLAHDGNVAVGFIALTETRSLYAGGVFGIIPEFYVNPEYRSRRIGAMLLAAAREHGISRGWTRLEVTTPPLPEFERTLHFYQANGFAIAGGRKLKAELGL
ncbi:MAG: GNAT family N-acetyltransferase [Sulfuricellaceae bacterium]